MPGQQGPWVVFARRQVDCPPHASCTPSTTTSSSATAVSAAQTKASTSASPVVAATSSTSHAGTIAGCVVGGVVFLVLVVLGTLLYLRARKRKRTPPSSEFMNSLKLGATPVLRLDSGTGYTPTLAEKGGGYTHHSAAPFMQNSSYASPPMQNMRFPDEMTVMTDTPRSGRPSVESPLHPQRFSSQQHVDDLFVAQHRSSASAGSRRELWGSDTAILSGELPPVREAESMLQFAPRVSLDEPSTQPSYLSHSPTSLQPLRRQPDPESVRYL